MEETTRVPAALCQEPGAETNTDISHYLTVLEQGSEPRPGIPKPEPSGQCWLPVAYQNLGSLSPHRGDLIPLLSTMSASPSQAHPWPRLPPDVPTILRMGLSGLATAWI